MRGCFPSLNIRSMVSRRQNTDQPSTNNAANPAERGVPSPKPTRNVPLNALKKLARRSGATAADMYKKTLNKKVTDNPILSTRASSPSRLKALPREMLGEIFQHMDAPTLATVSLVSRSLHYEVAPQLEKEKKEKKEKQLTLKVQQLHRDIPEVRDIQAFNRVLKRIEQLPVHRQGELLADLGGEMINLPHEQRREIGNAWLPVAEHVSAPRPGLLDAVVNAVRRDPETRERDDAFAMLDAVADLHQEVSVEEVASRHGITSPWDMVRLHRNARFYLKQRRTSTSRTTT